MPRVTEHTRSRANIGCFKMIQHTHEQNDVELTDAARIEIVHVHLLVLDARIQNLVDLMKVWVIKDVDCEHLGAAALHLEAEPAIPSANVEDSLAAKIVWNGELLDAALQARQIARSFNNLAIGQLKAVPPARLIHAALEFANVVEWPEIRFSDCVGQSYTFLKILFNFPTAVSTCFSVRMNGGRKRSTVS